MLYVVCFAILKSFICKNVQSEKALGQNWRKNLSVWAFEVAMLTMGFWLLMLTGNELWQDFWETYETSSKYELPQADSTLTLHLFTMLHCQRLFPPFTVQIVFTRVVGSYANFLEQKEIFTWEKSSIPTAFFCTSTWPLFYCFYTNMVAATSCDKDL